MSDESQQTPQPTAGAGPAEVQSEAGAEVAERPANTPDASAAVDEETAATAVSDNGQAEAPTDGQPDVEDAAMASAVREALRAVVDPEIQIDVVTLGLIRDIELGDDETVVHMILTTPFCPYAGSLVQQVKDVTRDVVQGDARVELGDEQWSPDMMEGGDWSEWGLV